MLINDMNGNPPVNDNREQDLLKKREKINKSIESKQSLSGSWNYRLDPEDIGIGLEWFKDSFLDELQLPGTLCDNEIGDPLILDEAIEIPLNPETVRSFQPKYTYIGPCWYQRKISLPTSWSTRYVILYLERIILGSTLWVNDIKVGSQASLVSAHEYDVSQAIKEIVSGIPRVVESETIEVCFTLRIDNRDLFHLSTYGHSYTRETQTIWNGIIGEICLYTYESFKIDKLFIQTPNNKEVHIKGKLLSNNRYESFILGLEIKDLETEAVVAYKNIDFSIKENQKEIFLETVIELDEPGVYWNEFQPKVYELHIEVPGSFRHIENFGFRRMHIEGRKIYINDLRVNLRGNLECVVHPLTGYPPCNVEYWKNIFTKIKDYGMNHVRFHSNCPPEAAFTAADALGMYLQIEGPGWLDTWFNALGSHKEHYNFLPSEMRRIIKTYSNHPSFCIFCNGNEFRGDMTLLHDMIQEAKSIRSDILYTLTANYDREVDINDDLFISVEAAGKGMRGNRFKEPMALGLATRYTEAVESRDIPIIAHEGGQFAVYPDIREIPDYTGNLIPYNYMAIEQDVKKNNLLGLVETYIEASGHLSARMYKEEIESYMRTMDFGGFQILGIQDFPGQCSATVGLLDSFWRSKGFVSSDWFKQFCNPTICLAIMDKRVFINAETMCFDLMINHFSPENLEETQLLWFLMDGQDIAYSGQFDLGTCQAGGQKIVGRVEDLNLLIFDKPKQLELVFKLVSKEVVPTNKVASTSTDNNSKKTRTVCKNTWDLWVFPELKEEFVDNYIKEQEVVVKRNFNKEVKDLLEEGGTVLLSLNKESFEEEAIFQGSFLPVFWSPVFFNSKEPCGCYIPQPEAFKEFPTDHYSNHQWYRIFNESYNFSIDHFSETMNPLIEIVPNYYTNHRLTNLLVGSYGNGRILVTSLDLNELNKYNEGRWFIKTIIDYLLSQDDQTLCPISEGELQSIFVQQKEEMKAELKEQFID